MALLQRGDAAQPGRGAWRQKRDTDKEYLKGTEGSGIVASELSDSRAADEEAWIERMGSLLFDYKEENLEA